MKDPLLTNKIAGAALAALILVFGLPQLTAAVLGGGHSGGYGDELHLAYCCVDLEAQDHAAADEPAPVDLGTLLANASIAGGERRAALCKSCHTLEEGGADGAGPNLWDIVNRNVAGKAGFNYTGALQAAGGVWSYDRLDEYLKNSQAYVPGTAMAQRFARDDRRADILAYLGSLSANPVAFPQPAAPEAPAEHPLEDIIEEAAHNGDATEHAADTLEGVANEMIDAAGEAAGGAIEQAADAAGNVLGAGDEAAEDIVDDAKDALQQEE